MPVGAAAHLTPAVCVLSAVRIKSFVPTPTRTGTALPVAARMSPFVVTIAFGIAASAVATPAVKKVASSPVKTCLTLAPAVWLTAEVPA